MAVGVGVEFTAHICLGFINSGKDNHAARVKEALLGFAMATVDGALSTLIGVIMLALSPFQFVRTYFFLIYMLIVVMGCFYGLVTLPLLLSVIGPASLIEEGGDGEGAVGNGSSDPSVSKNLKSVSVSKGDAE